MIYIASPYSHPDPAVREFRFREACRVVAKMLLSGKIVFSPIVHSHPLVEFSLPTDWTFWERIDRKYIALCDELAVLLLPGWKESVGVTAEIQIANEYQKRVRFILP